MRVHLSLLQLDLLGDAARLFQCGIDFLLLGGVHRTYLRLNGREQACKQWSLCMSAGRPAVNVTPGLFIHEVG